MVKKLNLILILAMVCVLPSVFADYSPFTEGAGTLANPYNITNCSQLQNMSYNVSGHYSLKNNINCSMTTNWNANAGFIPIGNSTKWFNGTLVSNNYIISSLFINNNTLTNVGLFGYVRDTSLNNINLNNISITGNNNVGGIIGTMNNTNFSSGYFSGSVSGSSNVGGGIGYITNSGIGTHVNVSNINIIANITCSGSSCGGIIGYAHNTTILNNNFTGNISGIDSTGGITGNLATGSKAIRNTIIATVLGRDFASGMIGDRGLGSIEIKYNKFIGTVNCSYECSGIVTNPLNMNVTNNYFIGNISANSTALGYAAVFHGWSSIYTGNISNNYFVGHTYSARSLTSGYRGCFFINSSSYLTMNINSSNYYNSDLCNDTIVNVSQGRTTAQMKQQSTYIGWDFNNVWFMPGLQDGLGYPYLQWEDSINTYIVNAKNSTESDYSLKALISGILYPQYNKMYNNNIETNLTYFSYNLTSNTLGLNWTGNSYFNGTIKYFEKYNRILSPEELTIIYNNGNFTPNKLGEANSSIFLNGNEYIAISNTSLVNSNSWTSCKYIKPISLVDQRLFSFSTYYEHLLPTNKYSFTNNGYATPITANNWTHLCTLSDGTNLKYYVNGVLINTSTGTSNFTVNGQIKIGTNMTGNMDEFMFYNYELSQMDISRLYNGYSTNDLDDCSSYNNTLVNIAVFNENVPTSYLNSTFDVFIEYTLDNDTSVEYNFSKRYTLAAGTNFSVCFANLQSTLNYDLYAQYTPLGTFTHRYYLFNQTYTNQTVFAQVGNYASTENVSRLNMVVRDLDNYQPLLGIVGKLQRFYVQEGIWRNVQMDKSADYGLLIYNIREADTDYRIIFTDTNNNIYKTTQPLKFSCSYGVCDLTYVLDTNVEPLLPNLNVSYYFDIPTKILTVNWSDTNAVTTGFRFEVKKDLYNGSVILCQNTSTGVAGTLTCNLTGYNGTISVYAYSSASPFSLKSAWVFEILDLTQKLFQYIGVRDGVFYSMGLGIVAMCAGLFSPIAAVILGIMSVLFTVLLGLNGIFAIPTIAGLCVIGILIGLKVRE